VLGGHKDLYRFGQKIPTSSVELLVLPALVCSRGYKRTREGEGLKSLMEELNGVELDSARLGFIPPVGRLVSPFIGQGEGTGYTRGRERTRRKRASGVASSFASLHGSRWSYR
jgi:hypothetical protein